MNTSAVLAIKVLYLGNTHHIVFVLYAYPYNGYDLVFILCAPVMLVNYRYKLKIDALMHDVIVELQAKVCADVSCAVETQTLTCRESVMSCILTSIHLLLFPLLISDQSLSIQSTCQHLKIGNV